MSDMKPAPRFLLVDDDADMRSLTREYLYSFGYEDVCEAEGVKAAIAILNSQRVDVIISDWDMPGANGYTLLKLIKLQEKFRHVSFMLVSSIKEHEEGKVKLAASMGVDAYLLKPFRASKFKTVLSELLALPK
jgi:two-component system chemotaxis response regulator CheY